MCESERGELPSENVEMDESEPESVIFVPSTPRGELVKRLRESDIQFRKGSKIKQINLYFMFAMSPNISSLSSYLNYQYPPV